METCCGYGYEPARHLHVHPSPEFSRSAASIRTPPQMRCSSRSEPYLPSIGFHGTRTLRQKRKLFPDLSAASSGHFGSPRRTLALRRANDYRNGSAAGFRNRNRIPFRSKGVCLKKHATSAQDLSLSLGSTDSRATTVHAKPFSTSVLQGLAGVFATTTKICTGPEAPGGLAPRPFCALRRARPTRHGITTSRFAGRHERP